jgi:hypothetical protein
MGRDPDSAWYAWYARSFEATRQQLINDDAELKRLEDNI